MQGRKHGFPQIWERIEREWEGFLRHYLSSYQNWAIGEEKVEVSDDGVNIFIPLPKDVKKEQLHFHREGNLLRIRLEDRQESRIEDERNHMYQISKQYKRAERVFPLPVPVRWEKGKVEWKDGGVWLIFPRR